ncbi:MAG: hypothetical protein ACPGUV_00650, partial [Polyangiales bacterium]
PAASSEAPDAMPERRPSAPLAATTTTATGAAEPSAPASARAAAPGMARPAPPTAPAQAPATPAMASTDTTLGAAERAQWRAVLQVLRQSEPGLAAIFEHARPQRITAEELCLAFAPGSFFAEQASQASSTDALAQAAAGQLGAVPQVHIATSQGALASAGQSVASLDEAHKRAYQDALEREAVNHPQVLAAMQCFSLGRDQAQVLIDEPGTSSASANAASVLS